MCVEVNDWGQTMMPIIFLTNTLCLWFVIKVSQWGSTYQDTASTLNPTNSCISQKLCSASSTMAIFHRHFNFQSQLWGEVMFCSQGYLLMHSVLFDDEKTQRKCSNPPWLKPTNNIWSSYKRKITKRPNAGLLSDHLWLQYLHVWLLRSGLIQTQGLDPRL